MTGYTVHTGSTKKFASGWEKVFGGSGTAKGKQDVKPAAKKSATAKARKPKKK